MPGAGVQYPESSVWNLHLDLLSLMIATYEPDHITKFARNGLDSARVKRVLKKPCECTGDSRCCAQQLSVAGVVEYCQRSHHLSEECRTHLIATSYETCGPVPTDKAIRTQWHLLGVRVCVVALAAILGVTPRTLYMRVHQAVDLRKGPWSVQPHAAPQQRIVDQFFAELYMSAAEHLAEQDLDIGKADDNIAHNAALPLVLQCPTSPCQIVHGTQTSVLAHSPSWQQAMTCTTSLCDICSMGVFLTSGGNSWHGGILWQMSHRKSKCAGHHSQRSG